MRVQFEETRVPIVKCHYTSGERTSLINLHASKWANYDFRNVSSLRLFLTKLGQRQIIQLLSSNDPIYLTNEIPCNYVICRVKMIYLIKFRCPVMNRNVIFAESINTVGN